MIYGNKFTNGELEILNENNFANSKIGNGIKLCGSENVRIDINPSEREFPHCHITIGSRTDKSSIKGCIMLLYPEYYNHEDYMKLCLDSGDRKAFNEWMNKIPRGSDINNWRILCNAWNNTTALVSKDCMMISPNHPQPNYSVIYPYKTFSKEK